MGHLTGYGNPVTAAGVGGKGFFGAPQPRPVTPASATFMVVSANNTDPTLANAPGAAWRDTNGVWHVINTAALGARGSYGVTHVNGVWYMTTNAPGALAPLIGKTADGSPPAAMSAVVTNIPDPLTAIDGSLGFKIGSLLGNIITAPANLSSFTVNSAGGPFGYVVLGIASNQDTP